MVVEMKCQLYNWIWLYVVLMLMVLMMMRSNYIWNQLNPTRRKGEEKSKQKSAGDWLTQSKRLGMTLFSPFFLTLRLHFLLSPLSPVFLPLFLFSLSSFFPAQKVFNDDRFLVLWYFIWYFNLPAPHLLIYPLEIGSFSATSIKSGRFVWFMFLYKRFKLLLFVPVHKYMKAWSIRKKELD